MVFIAQESYKGRIGCKFQIQSHDTKWLLTKLGRDVLIAPLDRKPGTRCTDAPHRLAIDYRDGCEMLARHRSVDRLENVPMKITDALLAEHVVFHNFFDYLERVAPKLKTSAEVKSFARLLEFLLEAHSRTEEELIVAPLDHCLEQIGQREAFHQEHMEIDANLKRAQTARDLKQARRYLLIAVVSSRKHFDKEERIVFPLAERLLTAKTLADLWKTWMHQRNRSLP